MDRLKKYPTTNVLIIEDNSDHWIIIQAAIKHFLPQANAVWAINNKAALDYLEKCVTTYQSLPKLILLDLYMPGREQGLDMLQKLKHNESRYRYTPVVVLSYSNSMNDIQDTYQLGCASYLVKPTEFEQWQDLFQRLKMYWWDTVIMPPQ